VCVPCAVSAVSVGLDKGCDCTVTGSRAGPAFTQPSGRFNSLV
jgi:hypothetical protein